MKNQMIEELIRFTHLEKTYGYLPGMSGATVAALFDLDEAPYQKTRQRFDENAREAGEHGLRH
jgi:acyl-CoA thioesterase I